MEVKLVLSSSSPSSSFSSFFYLRCHRLRVPFFFAFIHVFIIIIILPLLLLLLPPFVLLHAHLIVIVFLQYLSIPFLQTLTNAHHRHLCVAYISIASIHWAPTGANTTIGEKAVRVKNQWIIFFYISNWSIKFLWSKMKWQMQRITARGGDPIWNRRGCSSEILNLTPKGDHLGVAQAFCNL